MEFLYLFGIIFLFWFFLKLADAHDEHGMKSFLWAGMVYGIIWWSIWGYLVTYSQNLHTLYLVSLFYWIFKLKLDYTNHAVAGVIMLSCAFMSRYSFQIYPIFGILSSVIILDAIKTINKNTWKNRVIFKIFLMKPQFFIGPLVFATVTQDITILAYSADFLARYVTIKLFNIDQNKWK